MHQRTPPFPLVRRVLGLLIGVSAIFWAGCSCDQERTKKEPPDVSLPPLKVQSTPASIEAEIYPLEGSTKKSPVVMVLSEDSTYCPATQRKFAGRAHVLCSTSSSNGQAKPDAEAKLRAALVFMKKQYAGYLDSSPVLFVVGSPYGEVGFKMMLGEPAFFAHAFLGSFDPSNLTNTLLAALHGKGAKTLILGGEMDQKLQLLSTVAGRANLSVQTVGAGPQALERALALLIEADAERLKPSAQKPESIQEAESIQKAEQPNSTSP